MDGRDSDRVEEVAAISAGHQAKRNRHVRWAECRYADRANGLPELGGDDRRLVDARCLALVAAGADRREPLDRRDGLHAGPEGSPHIRYGDITFQVDEMRRPFPPIAGYHPVRHDRALPAPTQVSSRRADNVNVGKRGIWDEARETFVVTKATLRVAEQMQRRIEATRHAQQIAVDLSCRVPSLE